MLVGIVLGPSVLGMAFPNAWDTLFPLGSLNILSKLSQLGLLCFMFHIGTELDLNGIRNKKAVVLVSVTSIAVPFALGVGLALSAHRQLSCQTPSLASFTLFMGLAMSITAFPVLARILKEQDLLHTTMGAFCLSCAAIDDVVGWCLLAAISLAVGTRGNPHLMLDQIIGTVVFIFLAWYLVRPLLAKVSAQKGPFLDSKPGTLLSSIFTALVLFACSAVSNHLGIHGLFGAFFAGLVVPN